MGQHAQLGQRRVLVVGVGGLGCPVALCLAAAGLGTLVLVDPDRVELSNLNRQILHRTGGIGTAKVVSAAAQLRASYPGLGIEMHAERLTAANAARFFSEVDFVVDATDGVEAKFLINDTAVALRRPFSHAGVLGFQGQTLTVVPGRSACLRCLFPETPPADALPTCQEAGILGAVAGVIGAIQAGEVIKCLCGEGPLLTDRLLTFDGLAGRSRIVEVSPDPRCICRGAQRARA